MGCLLFTCTTLDVLLPIHDGQHLFALEDLFLHQRLRQAVQGIAVRGQDAAGLLVGLGDQPKVNANASTPTSRNSISSWRSAMGPGWRIS